MEENSTNQTQTTDDPCPIVRVYVDIFNIFVYGIGPIIILGMIFNIITLIVLNAQKSKLNSIYLLKLLAVSDMVFLLDCMVYFPIRHIYAYMKTGDEVFQRWEPANGPYMFAISIPIYFMAQQNRNWLVVLITVERFLNLVFPLWARAALTKRRLNYIFAVNVILAIGCNLYNYWAYPIVPNINPCTGEPEMTVVWQSWAREFDTYIYVAMTAMIPLFLLYFMNITLIVVLHRTFRQRGEMTGETKEATAQRQATLMVIGITVVFTLCETPASIDRFASFAGLRYSDDDPFFNYARKIGLLFVVLDSAVNFIAYVVSNRPFRQTLMQVCGCQSSDKPKNYSTN